MSELQDALDWYEEGEPMGTGMPPGDRMVLIVDAARRVANPDYEAAAEVDATHRPGVGPVTDRKRVKVIVNAALGITKDT